MSCILAPACARTIPRLVPFEGVEAGDIEENAAFERDRLTIVASAARPHGDWDPSARTRGRNPDDVGFVARQDQEVGGLAVEQLVEDGAIPEKVARASANRNRVGDERHAVDCGHQAIDIIAGIAG